MLYLYHREKNKNIQEKSLEILILLKYTLRTITWKAINV